MTLTVCLLLLFSLPVQAGIMDDLGYTALRRELGVNTPNGNDVRVAHVEAMNNGHWMPNPSHADFAGKAIRNASGDTGHSSHATGVGRRFYGNDINRSMAPGVTEIEAFETNHWIQDGFLRANCDGQPQNPDFRVTNHSWVGSSGSVGNDSIVLRRLDWVVETYDTIQVVGLTNSAASSKPLLGSAYNVITVGKTNTEHSRKTTSLDDGYDDIYKPARFRPDLVVPLSYTSATTPVGASAAALLLDAAKGTNAEKSEVIRAALMAGAERFTPCRCDTVFLGDYRTDPDEQTVNGLDTRYGAGQLNIQTSYHIVAAGEQAPGAIETSGYDYNPGFGGAHGSSDLAAYTFSAESSPTWLYAALAWNLDVNGGSSSYFNGYATLYDLDLELYDVDQGRIVAASTSQVANTESIWFPLQAGHSYELRVRQGSGQGDFLWDYGLAWHLSPDKDGDTDGDHLPDDWETDQGLDSSNPSDSLADPDSDGLTSYQEHCHGTDPHRADTDGDGLDDGSELEVWSGSCSDADDDSTPDIVDPDADDDGIDDGPEKDHWGDSWDADPDGDGLINLSDPDADNDGVSDGTEITAGSDPADPESLPQANPVTAYRLPELACSALLLLILGLLSQ